MSYQQVTDRERYFIAVHWSEGESQAYIAKLLKRHRSTISRELKRNSHPGGWYTPKLADTKAKARRRASRKTSRFSPSQWALIHSKLRVDWSPEQISGRLARLDIFKIHCATIYRHIRSHRKKDDRFQRHLRQGHKQRRKGYRRPDSRGILRGKRNIRERPKAATKRWELGHGEADLVRGHKGQGWVMSMVDRKSRFTHIRALKNKTASEVGKKIARIAREFKYKTLTVDNGCEFHGFKEVEKKTGIRFYFANAHRSWERGTIENTNGLIRQYLPKSMDLKNITQRECDFIANRLNQRPRKILGFKTPEECYLENL
jgi:IS30 family transposase